MQVYNENEFDNLLLTCPKCGWKGKGSESTIIDFFGVTSMREVHCPNCDEKLGEVRHTKNTTGSSGDELSNQMG